MSKFWSRNIGGWGRVVRGVWGLLFVIAGGLTWGFSLWLSLGLMLAGGFAWFEAVRGWCVMRACGIRTKL